MQRKIELKIQTHLRPQHLKVINESSNHHGPPGSETHFKLMIVSEKFDQLSLLDRHRRVHQILDHELKNYIHALSLLTLTPQEWTIRKGKISPSPICKSKALPFR